MPARRRSTTSSGRASAAPRVRPTTPGRRAVPVPLGQSELCPRIGPLRPRRAGRAERDLRQTGPTSTETGTGSDKLARSTIITENGERILFVGATTQLEAQLTSLGKRSPSTASRARDDMRALADQINAEVDRQLAANPCHTRSVGTHLQQLANEQALAPLLRNVDILIGGGSHTLLSDGNDRCCRATSRAAPTRSFIHQRERADPRARQHGLRVRLCRTAHRDLRRSGQPDPRLDRSGVLRRGRGGRHDCGAALRLDRGGLHAGLQGLSRARG